MTVFVGGRAPRLSQEGLKIMVFDVAQVESQLEYLTGRQLLGRREPDQVLTLIGSEYELAPAVAAAESLHVHVKVEDLADLPHSELGARGQLERWKAPGYVKYRLLGGINIIFSSFPVAQDDLIRGAVTLPRPFVDHFGIDMRREDTVTRNRFDAIPSMVEGRGWRTVKQGGPGRPVYGAHTQVAEKHWVFAAGGDDWHRPVEFAFGQLIVNEEYLGCDHRPIDPAHPLANTALPWEESRRSALPDDMKGIVVYVKSAEEQRDAEAVFAGLPGTPMRTRMLSNDHPEEFPDVVVALWLLKESCPLPLTVVDGYPVVTQRVPTETEAVRFTSEPVLAPAADVFG
ncbi:hypothetical protein [Allorhizocola rhizosphaerae]|uniref:hypothetical protein n=1 Tax=Allorhizocola rhizosphaerae TaxID=1872709 RepID=UPI000E3D5C8A|nr:hypothetical protein [Allorhizocola rhizosphaerae]